MNEISKNIINLLPEICLLFENKCIITGSCADFFHINYTDIEDIDLYIDEKDFNQSMIHNNGKLTLSRKLKCKTDGHLLYRLYYESIKIDLLVKKTELINSDIETITYKNFKYTVFGKNTRYDQLKSTTYQSYKNVYNPEYIKNKIKKAAFRLPVYEQILDSLKKPS